MTASDKNGRISSTFEPLQMVREAIVRAPRERLFQGHLLFEGKGGFTAALPVTLAERLSLFAECASPREWLGLLAGLVCEDVHGPYVVVLGVVPDTEAKADAASVRSTHESELRTRLALRTLYPDGTSVGWVHTHPGYGTRFSATDMATQSSWRVDHALGIVVDPTQAGAERFGVYRGPGAERLAYAGMGSRVAERSPWQASLRDALVTLASAIVTGIELTVEASVPVVEHVRQRYAESWRTRRRGRS